MDLGYESAVVYNILRLNTVQEMKVNWDTDTNAKSQKSKNLLTKAEWAEQV